VLSAHSGQGVPEALRALLEVIDAVKEAADAPARADAPAWTP
jgi:hypothetical protein